MAGRRTLRVGLTGGLACGKSTVLAVFARGGAATVDADRLAREALAPSSPLVARVRAAFGDGVVRADGSIDRARLAALVFADPERRRALEAIVHPEVIRREEEEVSRLEAEGAAIVVVDAALLVEAGRAPRFDRLVVVSCPEETQVARAVARGMDEEDARRRVAAQLPVAEKARRADYVIDSSDTPAETRERAREVLERLREDQDLLARGLALPRRRA